MDGFQFELKAINLFRDSFDPLTHLAQARIDDGQSLSGTTVRGRLRGYHRYRPHNNRDGTPVHILILRQFAAVCDARAKNVGLSTIPRISADHL